MNVGRRRWIDLSKNESSDKSFEDIFESAAQKAAEDIIGYSRCIFSGEQPEMRYPLDYLGEPITDNDL